MAEGSQIVRRERPSGDWGSAALDSPGPRGVASSDLRSTTPLATQLASVASTALTKSEPSSMSEATSAGAGPLDGSPFPADAADHSSGQRRNAFSCSFSKRATWSRASVISGSDLTSGWPMRTMSRFRIGGAPFNFGGGASAATRTHSFLTSVARRSISYWMELISTGWSFVLSMALRSRLSGEVIRGGRVDGADLHPTSGVLLYPASQARVVAYFRRIRSEAGHRCLELEKRERYFILVCLIWKIVLA